MGDPLLAKTGIPIAPAAINSPTAALPKTGPSTRPESRQKKFCSPSGTGPSGMAINPPAEIKAANSDTRVSFNIILFLISNSSFLTTNYI